MGEKMVYAPVLIPTLCRSAHFIRCVESLKRNSFAKYTEVFIGLDYPSKEAHRKGYEEICRYLEGDFHEFAAFHVIKMDENCGPGKNMTNLREIVFERFDRYIRTDDDAEFSPNFLEYMNKCLTFYEDDPDVIAVTGYSYPLDWKVENGCNTFKCNFICPVWGIGYWRDKLISIYEQIIDQRYLRSSFDQMVKSGKIKQLTDARFLSYTACLRNEYSIFLDRPTDITLGIYLTIADKFVIAPTLSKVRNWGFDGTGIYCQDVNAIHQRKITAQNYHYSEQPIDISDSFELCPDDSIDCRYNKALMNKFDTVKKTKLITAKMKLGVYRIVGKENYARIRNRIKTASRGADK